MVSVFRPLPEFAAVKAGEERTVFLRLVFEDGLAFDNDLFRTEWHRHINQLGFPFLPGATIQP